MLMSMALCVFGKLPTGARARESEYALASQSVDSWKAEKLRTQQTFDYFFSVLL